MDPSIANIPGLNPSAGGIVPVFTVVGIGAGAVVSLAGGVSISAIVSSKRRRALWRRVGLELGLRLETGSETTTALLATPVLRGIRHGRAVEATLLANGLARIAVRVANPRHLLDQIPTSDPTALAGAAWLTEVQRQELGALSDRRRLGSVSVRGSFVTLTAPFVAANRTDSAPLRSLFHLAHNIAEGVDSASVSSTPRSTPTRPHRRLGPGTLTSMSHRRA